ncbi:MAG: NAD(P)/FAD-dependent oxidoreductase [Pseudonocardiaceae bacterium]
MTTTQSKPTRPHHETGHEPDADVIILGAGLAGSVLGAVLARNGAKTLLIDAGSHPKFAVGESMIGYTLLLLRSIAERYGVPEIATLATFDSCVSEINHSFGWKKHFGFLRHEMGKEPNWWEAAQLNTPGVLNKSSHLFRQDTDTYLFHTAVRYGCDVKLGHLVTDVEVTDDGVLVRGKDGSEFRGRYLVDASGFRSPLAAKLGLREEPSRLKHHSRSIFTHMIDVPRADDVLWHSDAQRPPVPWHHGTMHHHFDRGWFWVIPFGNNPRSTNSLCSVGLTMDERKYPKSERLSPEAEFFEFASRFPAVRRQFAGAKPVREWVSTSRLQYSSTRSIGPRWCLMSHAAGFIDPLFSRGISNTAEVINALGWRLLEALADDDFSVERFEYIERLEQGLLDYNDDLVNSAFISFDHYELWSAVFRVWAYGSVVGGNRLQSALARFRQTGDDGHLRALEDPPNVGLWWPDHDGYKKLFDDMVANTAAVDAGTRDPAEAAQRLFAHLKSADYIPHKFGFSDIEKRFLKPDAKSLISLLGWILRQAPADVREIYLDTAKEVVKAVAAGRRAF